MPINCETGPSSVTCLLMLQGNYPSSLLRSQGNCPSSLLTPVTPRTRRGLFGGQIMGQALAAASSTVDHKGSGKMLHSMHACGPRDAFAFSPARGRALDTQSSKLKGNPI